MAGYRPPYTIEEKKKILRYIIDKKGYALLRGREFWQNMEADEVINRTWQSMKEHFRIQLYPNLRHPHLSLTAEEIEKIESGMKATQATPVQKKTTSHYSSDTSSRQMKELDLNDIMNTSSDED